MGTIGLILAIVVLIVFAYKGLGALPLAILGSLVAILFNGMPVWQSFVDYFIPGYASAIPSFLAIFVTSALYAKFMDISGCATSIGFKLVDWFGTKHVVLVGMVMVAVLTYGGISLFVVIFATAPVLFTLFKEANLPRHLTVACFSAGSSTLTMTCLPGSPSMSNVVPTQYLGTTLNAAPVMGIVCGLIMFGMCIAYGEWATKKARQRQEIWTYPANVNPAMYEVKDRSQLPAPWKAFTTIIVLLAIIIIGSARGLNGTMLTVIAMLVGSVLVVALCPTNFKGINWFKTVSAGMANGVSSIAGIASILGFGAVVKATPAYTDVVNWVLSLDMNFYVLAVVATCVICGITGGSSSGQKIMYETLAPTFINSGCNLNVLHRLCAIASGSLDTLPHSSGLFAVYDVLGLTHKEAYRHSFATTVLIPFIVTVVATAIVAVVY